MRTITRSIVVRTLIAVTGVLLCASRVAAQTETVEYYGLDALGSVRVVFDASGNVTGRMDYGPFGESLVTGSGLPSRAYAGLFRDGEAGLDHADARSYQVRNARFTSIDPVSGSADRPQSWNRYSYTFNNPLAFTDSSGADPNPSTASTYQTVNCGLGAYWCPGAVRGANVDRYFDPNQYGYHGGEMAVAEAQYAAAIEVNRTIAQTAWTNVGSKDYLESKAKDGFKAGTNKCNQFCADVIELSGIPRPQVPKSGILGWLGFTRDPTAHEWADPSVQISAWSAPKPILWAQPGDVIAQEHGLFGHVGIVFVPGVTISVNSTTNPAGIVTANNWGFRSAGGNGEGPYDPQPVVRTYIGRRR